MRIFNKIVGSKTPPENTNDVWFDGENFKVCINTEWVIVGNGGSIPTVTTNLFEIVSKLPESGNKDKIYLVPSENKEEGNKWIEWAYINSAWEQLGPSKLTNGESYDDSEIRELLDSKLESEIFLGTSIEGISAPYVSYNPQQLTEEQKSVARSNLGIDKTGGASIEVDTRFDMYSQNPIANAPVTIEFDKVWAKINFSQVVTFDSLVDAEMLKEVFNKWRLEKFLNQPISCYIKEEGNEERYEIATLVVEKYESATVGQFDYKLNFIRFDATSQFKVYDENGEDMGYYNPEWQWSPRCRLINGICDSYLIQSNGYVMHLGKGALIIADEELDATSERPISNKALCKALQDIKIFEFVESLPVEGKADKVYLVFNKNGSSDNGLIEWIWIDGKWEKLGEFKADVNLSEYAKKIDLATINGKRIDEGGNIEIEGGEGGSYDDTEIRQEITELSTEVGGVSVVINGKPQETLDWQQNGYYSITESVMEGAVVNINVQSQPVHRCLMVECAEGDSFLYTGRNSSFRPFAFLDSEYRLLPNYGVFGTKYTNEQIIAPQGAAYVIMQTIYNEWVELGSLPLQRLKRTGIEEQAKNAVLITPKAYKADEAIQAFTNLGVKAMKLNNVFSYGNFADTSVWSARPNTSLSFLNGVARMEVSGTSSTVGITTNKVTEIVVPSNKKVFFASRIKTNQDNLFFKISINGPSYHDLRSQYPVNKNSEWEWSIIEWTPEIAYTATFLNVEALTLGVNMTPDGWVEMKDFIVGIYSDEDNMTYDNFVALLQSQEWFYGSVVIPNAERFIALDSQIRRDVVVSVGEDGDFQSITAAMAYLSQFYPMYKYGGIKAEIRILNGTTITDQVLVVGADYSWMTITYEGYNPDGLTYDNVAESIANGTIVFGQTSGYNAVAVDASSWRSSGITHDTRGDVCLFRAEDGGRLPKIKCVFQLTNKGEYDVAGICCNRGSSCVVATLCGFIGFNDGVIANNESSITIREGITMNCGRWGCHARHNGEVSARSVIATGCATDTKYSAESAALCADRIADLDGREAWVSCGNAFAVRNTSRMNCNGTHVLGTADETAIIYAAAVGVGNFTSLYIDAGVKIDHLAGAMLSVSEYTFRESYVFNSITNKGIIYK